MKYLTCLVLVLLTWGQDVYADRSNKQVLKIGYVGPFSPVKDKNMSQKTFKYDMLNSVGVTQCYNGLKWYVDKINNDKRLVIPYT
jgi:hypothetical protein